MPYAAFRWPGFGSGLNLRDQPDVVDPAEAIDCLNVVFTERGAVKSRDGYDNLTGSALTNRGDSCAAYYETDGTKQLLVGCGTRLEAVSTAGAVVASATGLAGGPYTFARFGTPNSESAYAGNGTDTLRKWDGAAWSAPTATVDGAGTLAMPRGKLLAVDNDSNRLVVSGFDTTTGGPNAATSSPSHVYWSEPGLPETYLTANTVQLRPGDGEEITAMVAWRGQVFVFKETAFWRFWGETVDGTGTVTFEYTPIETGVGCVGPLAACAGRDGVYFVSRNGVYRTTGGEPQLLSDKIDPVFNGGSSDFYLGGELNHGQLAKVAIHWHDERVYVAFPKSGSTTNDRVLVHDPRYGWWSIWDIPAAALATFRISDQGELVFPYATGSNHIGRHTSSYTTDDGAEITSRWRSGWVDMGDVAVKTVRESKLWGLGVLRYAVAPDFSTNAGENVVTFGATSDTWADGTGSDVWGDGTGSDTWGGGQTLNPKLTRRAVRGTVFAVEARNEDSTRWSLNRLNLHLRESRGATLTKVDD